MSKYNLDPGVLDDLENERAYAESRDTSARRLKLEKGDKALVRVLPVNLTNDPDRRQWYARVGFHWADRRFVICPRTTQPIFGGDPEAPCPVCDVVEKHLDSRDEAIRKKASMASSFPNWLIYVLVLEIYRRGDDEPTFPPKKDMNVPHSLWLKRPTWLDLSDMFKRSLRRVPDFGILNPLEGYDIMIKKDARGNVTLERAEDPLPIHKGIRSLDEGMEYVDSIFKTIRGEKLTPNNEKELREFARKFADSLEYGDERQEGGRRGRSSVDEDEDADVGRGRRGRDDDNRGGRGEERVPARSARREPEEDRPARSSRIDEDRPARSEPHSDDRGERGSRDDERPARTARRDPDEDPDVDPVISGRDDRRQARAEDYPPERENEPRSRQRDPDADEPPAVRASAPPATRVTPPPASRVTPPPASRRPPPEDPDRNGEDSVAPERHDPAPAVPADQEPTPADELPQVRTTTSPKPTGRLSESLRQSISRLDNR